MGCLQNRALSLRVASTHPGCSEPVSRARDNTRRHGRRVFASLVSLTHLYWQLVLYAVPLALLISMSFWVTENFQFVPAVSLDNYAALIAKPQYSIGLWNSLRYAGIGAVAATALSLPLAYTLAFVVPERWRPWAVALVLLPYFSDVVVRMFAWQLWLSNQGIVAEAMQAVGFGGTELGILYTETASLVGLLSLLVPVSAMLIFLGFIQINPILVLAAENLGASRGQIFWRVQAPFAGPAVVTSVLICFLTAIGDFVASSILGGNRTFYLTAAIEGRLKIDDWPMAAALGVVILLVSAVLIVGLLHLLAWIPSISPPRRKATAL
jgi:spermidine/putrescine transport system permease protein